MIAALVPAAGRSTRMGRPKLILEIGGRTVIDRLVRSLCDGGADPVVVVGPPVDEAGADVLADQARSAGATVLRCPSMTPDMRATVEFGLGHLAGSEPLPSAILLVPGDSPGVTSGLVSQIIQTFRADPSRIIVPRSGGRRGHPVAIPWELARTIPRLPTGTGVNALLAEHAEHVRMLDLEDPGAIADLDTPEDYRRWAAGPSS